MVSICYLSSSKICYKKIVLHDSLSSATLITSLPEDYERKLKCNLNFSQVGLVYQVEAKKGNVKMFVWPDVFCQVEILKMFFL